MGTVYEAVRTDGLYKKHVALKLLHSNPATDEAQQRFRFERNILAQLQHPGITQLLDGGITDHGQAYLVMQFVEGNPIDIYCDQKQLNIPSRIMLFLQLCEAVQYAHQNLILHRDLKPSNVLVTELGVAGFSPGGGTGNEAQEPQPKARLLDFGIAKALDSERLDMTQPVTIEAKRMMTPAYAAPEQILGKPLSTSTDVYALGVLCYVLLTGSPPYPVSGRPTHEVERIILEQEPIRPSLAAKQTDEGLAKKRDTTPQELGRLIAGDLDKIVEIPVTAMENAPKGPVDGGLDRLDAEIATTDRRVEEERAQAEACERRERLAATLTSPRNDRFAQRVAGRENDRLHQYMIEHVKVQPVHPLSGLTVYNV
jgi:eukaryotic-like serine/threonine-protein kinase